MGDKAQAKPKRATKRAAKATRMRDPTADGRSEIFAVNFYYLTLTQAGGAVESVTAHNYLATAPIQDIGGLIQTLAENAHRLGLRDPTCHGTSFDDLRRRRISYFAIIVNDPSLRKLEDLTIYDNIVNDVKPENYGNHNFGTKTYNELQVGSGSAQRNLQIVYCVNAMISKQTGKELGEKEAEAFKFSLTLARKKARATIRYPDSGGTNMGPPAPPPARRRRRK